MFCQTSSLTQDEVRQAFQRAAAHGKSYLLVLEEVCATGFSECQVSTRAINDQAEIADILKEGNALADHGTTTKLTGMYDVRGDFEAQYVQPAAEQLKMLTPAAQVAVDSYQMARDFKSMLPPRSLSLWHALRFW